MDPDYKSLSDKLGVSRETYQHYQHYVATLQKWQASKNLIASATMPAVWVRHVADSLQLALHVDLGSRIVTDLGSGAGFPGLVLAILSASRRDGAQYQLVEANHRKCAFLRQIVLDCSLPNVRIVNARIEDVPHDASYQAADIVTARALAGLSQLMAWSAPCMKEQGVMLYLKGRNVDVELEEARQGWKFTLTRYASITEPEASIIHLADISQA